MTIFVISACLLLVLVLVLLLRPFIFSTKQEGTSRRQMNAAIYREELDKLDVERDAGHLTSADYEIAHAELRQRLFQDTHEADDQSVMGSSKPTILVIVIFTALLSTGLYFLYGDAARVSQLQASQPMTQERVEKMVAEFAAKMEQDPTNLKGWAMLARSYRILGRNEDALKAFERTGNFIDSDPELLAEYADTLVAKANGSFAGKPARLIQQALKLDPNNVLALWLSGTAAYQAGNYSAAVKTWERLTQQLPPGTDEARAVESSIADARSKGGIAVQKLAAPSGKTISGKIVIAPELKKQVQSGDVMMVIARKPGERMPVAVLKLPVGEWPMSFVLNDALAMNPSTPLSTLSEVDIEVRVSKTGMAKAEAGDLLSAVQKVRVGATNVQLVVNQVRQ
jgi:cytochrome c-type biogenesis protein CcmH